MRQVMPHRNNIVAGRRVASLFFAAMGCRPLNSEELSHSGPSRDDAREANKIRSYQCI